MSYQRTTKFYRDGMEVSIAELTAEMVSAASDAGVDPDLARSVVTDAVAGDTGARELIDGLTGCVAVDEVVALLTAGPA